MEYLSIRHTIDIFERLFRRMPPLVPEGVVTDMAAALEQVRLNNTLTLEQVEETVLLFGKRLWPHRKAFAEFVAIFDGEMGEEYFRGHLSQALSKRYQEFLAYGGTYRDLHTGRPAAFFTSEERGKLCEALVATEQDIRTYARQAVVSTDRLRYKARVREFADILVDIERQLDSLRMMADLEQEHPALATEIRAQIRSFEEGLCFLGEETRYEAVCQAFDHFTGRKVEKKLRVRI